MTSRDLSILCWSQLRFIYTRFLITASPPPIPRSPNFAAICVFPSAVQGNRDPGKETSGGASRGEGAGGHKGGGARGAGCQRGPGRGGTDQEREGRRRSPERSPRVEEFTYASLVIKHRGEGAWVRYKPSKLGFFPLAQVLEYLRSTSEVLVSCRCAVGGGDRDRLTVFRMTIAAETTAVVA